MHHHCMEVAKESPAAAPFYLSQRVGAVTRSAKHSMGEDEAQLLSQ